MIEAANLEKYIYSLDGQLIAPGDSGVQEMDIGSPVYFASANGTFVPRLDMN